MHFTHKQGSAEYLILALPNDADSSDNTFDPEKNEAWLTIYDADGNWIDDIDLPPNNYEIIYSGLLDEVSEENIKQLVNGLGSVEGVYYEDYTKKDINPFYILDTRKESFLSLIRSKGWFTENKYPKPTCECLCEFDREGCEEKCLLWINENNRVVNKIAILKIV